MTIVLAALLCGPGSCVKIGRKNIKISTKFFSAGWWFFLILLSMTLLGFRAHFWQTSERLVFCSGSSTQNSSLEEGLELESALSSSVSATDGSGVTSGAERGNLRSKIPGAVSFALA